MYTNALLEANLAVNTTNGYGKISVSNNVIALVTGYIARECYGVVDIVSKNLIDYLRPFILRNPLAKGIEVTTYDNRITIDLNLVLKYGVNVRAVSESVRKTIKYRVEEFTGMIIDAVNVHIVGVRV